MLVYLENDFSVYFCDSSLVPRLPLLLDLDPLEKLLKRLFILVFGLGLV